MVLGLSIGLDQGYSNTVFSAHTSMDKTSSRRKNMKKFCLAMMLIVVYTLVYAQGWNYSSAVVLDAVEWNGDLWIATENGLQMHDLQDNRIVSYMRSSSGLPNNEVKSLVVDDNNILWIGTGNGLASFNGTRWNVFNRENSRIVDTDINSIAFDSRKRLWIATDDGGISVLDGSNWQSYTSEDSPLLSDEVMQVLVLPDGTIWLAADGGTVRITGDIWTVYTDLSGSRPPRNSTDVCVDPRGTVWLAHYEEIVSYDGENFSRHSLPDFNHQQPSINCFYPDFNGDLLVGTSVGIFGFNGSIWRKMDSLNTRLPHLCVNFISKNPRGELLIGTNDGLVLISGESSRVFHTGQ